MTTGMMAPDREIHFIWVDKDDIRMSPVHKDFGKALSWVSDWSKKKAKIEERAARTTEQLAHERQRSITRGEPMADYRFDFFEQEAEKSREAMEKLTLTGNPPAALRRLVITTTIEDPSEMEQALAATELEKMDLPKTEKENDVSAQS